MSQNVLHRQLGFDNRNLRQSFSYHLQSRTPFDCTPNTSSQLNGTVLHNPSMAQSLLQYQYRPENDLQAQTWRHQQALPREYRYTAGATPTSQRQFWDSSENAFTWNSALSLEPLTVLESDGVTSTGFTYEDMAVSQNVIGRNEYCNGQTSWMPPPAFEVYRSGMSIHGSDFDTVSSTSPKSFFSSTGDGASPDNWSNFDIYPPVKQSTPKITTPAVYPDEGASDTDFSGLPTHGMSMNMPTVATEADQRYASNFSLNHSKHFGSGQPSSYKSSPGAIPWYPPGYSSDLSGLPYNPQASQTTSFGSQRGVFSTQKEATTQDQLQAPRCDTQALRKADDKILIEGKDVLGLTYKEIRKRMYTNVAESTLRGRYRSLTKPKGHRVRKPVWTQNDVALLRKAVFQEIDRIETAHGYGLNHDSKLGKVQWKKIAEYIDDNGGTYHFGNATCKKKWIEIEGTPLSPLTKRQSPF